MRDIDGKVLDLSSRGSNPGPFTGKLYHSGEQWHVPLDATVASAWVERGGWAGICTLWQFRSKPCYYIYLSLPQSFLTCHLSLYNDFLQMQLTVAGIVLSRPLFDIQLPQCTNACTSSSIHSWHIPLWHQVAHYTTAIQSGIISQCLV